MDDDLSGPEGPNRESAVGKPPPKATCTTTLPAEEKQIAEEALAREKALDAVAKARPQVAPVSVNDDAGCFWAVWSQAQPWLEGESFRRN